MVQGRPYHRNYDPPVHRRPCIRYNNVVGRFQDHIRIGNQCNDHIPRGHMKWSVNIGTRVWINDEPTHVHHIRQFSGIRAAERHALTCVKTFMRRFYRLVNTRTPVTKQFTNARSLMGSKLFWMFQVEYCHFYGIGFSDPIITCTVERTKNPAQEVGDPLPWDMDTEPCV